RAKQSDPTFLVDGIVGNQTWAMLRQATPEPPSTDGRVPHTFREERTEARWFREHEPFFYFKSADQAKLVVASVGDTPIPKSIPVRGRITAPGAPKPRVVETTIDVPPFARTPDDQGDLHSVAVNNLRKLFPSAPADVPIEQFFLEAVIL